MKFGGPGSGHHGHAGRMGTRGGSAPGTVKGWKPSGGGYTPEFITGFDAKKQRAYWKKHGITSGEVKEGLTPAQIRKLLPGMSRTEIEEMEFAEPHRNKASRNPHVPAGDNYHPSVGWY